MTGRSGFSLLEAVVALAIVGLAAVASVEAVSAHLRAAERAMAALDAEALMQDRLARLRLLSREELAHLPDSMAQGQFGASLAGVAWRAASAEDRSRPALFHLSVELVEAKGNRRLETTVYRPRTGVSR